MKTMTTEDRLKEAGRMVQHITERAENNIAEYMEAAHKDFCNFFHQYVAATYQAQKMLVYFSKMLEIMSYYDDIASLTKAIKSRIEDIEIELINNSALWNYAHEVLNFENRLDLDSKRIIRKKLLNMLWILEK